MQIFGDYNPNFLHSYLLDHMVCVPFVALCSEMWKLVKKKESRSNPQLPQPVLYDYFKPSTLLSPALLSHDLVTGLLIFPVFATKAFIRHHRLVCCCQYVMNIEWRSPISPPHHHQSWGCASCLAHSLKWTVWPRDKKEDIAWSQRLVGGGG